MRRGVKGLVAPTVRRAIADLAEAGAVETGYRSLALRDTAVLRRFVDEQ